jgi:hypothetical protein
MLMTQKIYQLSHTDMCALTRKCAWAHNGGKLRIYLERDLGNWVL